MNYTNVIETRYDGMVFRSRTEARWAVFFNAMRLDWQYEPEGYILKNGEAYLPDFYVKEFGGGGFFEVKPDTLIDPAWKFRLEMLHESTGEKCFLLNGPPDFKFYLRLCPAYPEYEPAAYWSAVGFCGGDGNYMNKSGMWHDPDDFDLARDYYEGDKEKARDFFWTPYVEAVLKARAHRFQS